jgi:threonine synthase
LLNILRCPACGKEYNPSQINTLCSCGKPLLATYHLDQIKVTPEEVRTRKERSMWKFREVMPVKNPENIVSLGEGMTPLLHLEARGAFADYSNLYVKDEAINPTGSFKARGISAAVSMAKELGIKTLAIPSAGNAAGATSAYAARAGMECYIFMPQDTPATIVKECVTLGAHVYLVDGLISDCGKIVAQGAAKFGWFALSTLKEPYRIEGKKTMGYELAFDLDFELPDVIVYPTGGGTGLIGMWKAFDEMEELGWIGSKRPRMVSVQSAGCAPIVRAYEKHVHDAGFWDGAATVASGLRVPSAVGDFLILDAVYESGGAAVAVTDEELMQGQSELARYQGIFAAPEGGATWAALQKLRAQGKIQPDEKVVLFNTGSGLKYTELIKLDLPILDPSDPDILSKL